MSVTFALQYQATGTFRVSAFCDEAAEVNAPEYPSQTEAQRAANDHAAQCDECAVYGVHVQAVTDVDDAPKVSLANANAGRILTRLDLRLVTDDDLLGSRPAREFSDRVAHAAEQILDGWPYQGEDDYYAMEVLARLQVLAQEAIRRERPVIWG